MLFKDEGGRMKAEPERKPAQELYSSFIPHPEGGRMKDESERRTL
jgi:hypothetical protein